MTERHPPRIVPMPRPDYTIDHTHRPWTRRGRWFSFVAALVTVGVVLSLWFWVLL